MNETVRRTLESFQISPSSLNHLEEKATIDFKNEVIRKGIHLLSLSIPIIYYFIPKSLALSILIPLTAVFLLADIGRLYYPVIATWFYSWFGWLLRKHEVSEKKRLTGASNVLISALICVLLFPKIIMVTAFAILIISDITSALVGRRYGKHPFLAKSLEGSTAFFISAVLVVLAAPKVHYHISEYIIGIFAAFIGTIVEALSIHIDDNLSIPLSIGFTLWALYSIFLPTLPLY
ncbi:MAG: dolichol kinase [Bacteroidetes bacterium]|nr:dolichol kinase [Bacteroidota bacterium]